MTRPGSGYTRRVTKAALEQFKRFLRTGSEPAAQPQPNASGDDDPSVEFPTADAQSPFGVGNPLAIPSPLRSHPQGVDRQQLTRPSEPSPSQAPTFDAQSLTTGTLLWQKSLSATDAQRQAGNVTGDLRLTQAGFQVGGHTIDQTTYFREEVFTGANWVDEGLSEVADFTFVVTVFGQYLGTYALRVSHKPSGEVMQGNYTTNIRWGPISDQLRNQFDVTGANLELRIMNESDSAQFAIIIA